MFSPPLFGSRCPLLPPFAGPGLSQGLTPEAVTAPHPPSAALGLPHSAGLGTGSRRHCMEQSRRSVNQLADCLPQTQSPGILFLSCMAHKFLTDNPYSHSLFLTWLLLGNCFILETLELRYSRSAPWHWFCLVIAWILHFRPIPSPHSCHK